MSFFFFHYWLIKVHVEVSVDLSIYFSRILIKLGLYGIIRLIYYLCFLKFWFFYFRFFGFFFVSCFNFINRDLKIYIAYSSIIYINLSLILVFVFSYYRISWFVLINFFHRFSSILYFISFGLINYLSKSRLLIVNIGFFSLCSNRMLQLKYCQDRLLLTKNYVHLHSIVTIKWNFLFYDGMLQYLVLNQLHIHLNLLQ